MAYDYSELLTQARQWAAAAQAEGRLSAKRAQLLTTIDTRSADNLFAASVSDPDARPLIVAFMGGTGVGKSSLLNRLAGQAIARAGIERPTSREVTLYHHQSLAINKLPAGLPLDSIKISQHNDAANSHIVWIDMPDFDSVELSNKRLVLEWLPHIDVLLYVVSPERYRDNKAWQLLLAEGAKHAWLFVMNQWDRGQPVQYDDFKKQLGKAGFSDPLIFRTSCSEPDGDEFAQLLEQLRQLSGRHSVAQLELRGEQFRRQQLQQALQQLADEFSGQDYQQLLQNLDALWQHAEASLQQGLAWPIKQLAQFWAENLGQKAEIKLWDDWAQNRLNDLLDELILQAAQANIPSKPLKTALQTIRDNAEKNLTAQTELAGRQALLKPGNGAQRFLLKLTAICETLLPLAAMGAVGYQVFSGYYHSAADATAYLGTDFAVHSVLLIALSWLIPFFLHKKIQPSLQKAALKGLQKGLQQGLSAVMAEIKLTMQAEQQRNELLRQQLLTMIERCAAEPVASIDKGSLLGRVLLAD
ncbi:GTPase domain-containing protein [Methylomonas montana]|uniref:GTPase n=1 Tax=Methylomonas montana TaxID=3058963 RepID=UPI0026594AF5|nr:GTPase domain-containing protein [Methylomonas montana]WKJ89056.1 GTPase domain-containing protein [Methylomonas montana]